MYVNALTQINTWPSKTIRLDAHKYIIIIYLLLNY